MAANRLNPQECVFCHNPNMHDDQEPAESLDFKRLIHRIHRGEDLTQTYLELQQRACFRETSATARPATPAAASRSPRTAPAGRLPTDDAARLVHAAAADAAACLACHDTQAAAAHAFTMTAPFGEACATCHGPGAEFSVDKVHAQ